MKFVSLTQKLWRPVLMWVFILIIVLKYIVAPIAGFDYEIPVQLWDCIQLLVSIYIGGRSLEKVAPILGSLSSSSAPFASKKKAVAEDYTGSVIISHKAPAVFDAAAGLYSLSL